MKAAALLFTLLFLTAAVQAQTGACEVRSADSSLFRLTVKGYSLGDSAMATWRFAGAPGVYEMHLFPSDSSNYYMNSTVEIIPGKSRTYELFFTEDRSEFALGVAAEMPYRESPVEIMLDDTTLAAIREMNSGVAGQFPPLVNTHFDKLLEGLRETYFQNERADLITAYFEEYPVNIEELRQILASIDAEDRRLDLTLSAVGNLEDPRRIVELEDLFYLNSSKQRLKKVAQAVER